MAVDNFIKGADIEKLIEGGVSSPAYLMLAFLPSFISVWIATIMYKIFLRLIEFNPIKNCLLYSDLSFTQF